MFAKVWRTKTGLDYVDDSVTQILTVYAEPKKRKLP